MRKLDDHVLNELAVFISRQMQLAPGLRGKWLRKIEATDDTQNRAKRSGQSPSQPTAPADLPVILVNGEEVVDTVLTDGGPAVVSEGHRGGKLSVSVAGGTLMVQFEEGESDAKSGPDTGGDSQHADAERGAGSQHSEAGAADRVEDDGGGHRQAGDQARDDQASTGSEARGDDSRPFINKVNKAKDRYKITLSCGHEFMTKKRADKPEIGTPTDCAECAENE